MSLKKDYYKLLEVTKTSSPEDIKKSYYALAKKFHPDKNPNDPSSAEKFKLIKEAYENLSDPNKKAIYDSGGSSPGAGLHGGSGQAKYKSSSFPQFFTRNPGGATRGPSPGPRIFTFNVFGGNIPVEEVLKMFFAGTSNFGQYPNKQAPPTTAPNQNAISTCHFCRGIFTVADLIKHQNLCPKRPKTQEDFNKMFPGDAGPSNRTTDWKQQQKGGQDNRSWSNPFPAESDDEYAFYKSGFVECPTCRRKFNLDAASHHIPFCIKKTKEEGKAPNPLHKDQNSFQKSKEYAENLRKKQKDEDNHNSNISNNNNYSDYNNILQDHFGKFP